jgi:hypothetical protein
MIDLLAVRIRANPGFFGKKLEQFSWRIDNW